MATERGLNRRFTIADGMILVAAAAVPFALLSLRVGPRRDRVFAVVLQFYSASMFGSRDLKVIATALLLCAVPFVLALSSASVALFSMRLRRPRPSWVRLGRQPGAIAMLLVTGGVAFVIFVALVLSRIIIDANELAETLIVLVPNISASLIGALIAGGWLAIVAASRFRPEPTWLDRSGRILGACWLLLGSIAFAALVFLLYDEVF